MESGNLGLGFLPWKKWISLNPLFGGVGAWRTPLNKFGSPHRESGSLEESGGMTFTRSEKTQT